MLMMGNSLIFKQILESNQVEKIDNVYYLSDPSEFTKKEEIYLAVRKKEGHLYSKKEIKHLPIIRKDHKLFNEWKLRTLSITRFINHIESRSINFILDLGCGNGWASNLISKNINCNIFALDINKFELKQGAAIFSQNKNLNFIYGDIFDHFFQRNSLDIILLNAAIHYFPDLPQLIDYLLSILAFNGEIHILDSMFYSKKRIFNAKTRTQKYYTLMGFSKMEKYYFHHCIEDLQMYNMEILYKPSKLKILSNKLINSSFPFIKILHSPFPWIKIQK